MSTITIDFVDYLSDEDKRDICREEFRRVAAGTSKVDFERILSNAGYHFVYEEVNKAFDGDMTSIIKSKAIEVIKNLSGHAVFRPANAWDKEPSKGWTILQSALDDLQPMIAAQVESIIASVNEDDLRESIGERIASAVIAKLSATATGAA